MAQFQVGCSITTAGSRLSSELMMGYRAEGKKEGEHWWIQVWGRLPLGSMEGSVMYFRDGIVIARTNDVDNPVFDTPGNLIVVMENVPPRYAEQVTPQKALNGIGRILFTNEEVRWELWHPTRPIKR